MPEGDTLHRAATRLRPGLVGRAVVRFEAPRHTGSVPRPGTVITAVDAHGKYLVIDFDDGHQLQTHLRMTGRWDLYRSGERWRRPAYLARVIIEVDGFVAVCFSAPVVRLARVSGPAGVVDPDDDGQDGGEGGREDASASAAPPTATVRDVRSGPMSLEHLGPDLCRADADLAAAAERMDRLARPEDDIADVLLNQQVMAGVGNVFKSEVLWACRLHPLTPLRDVDAATRTRLVATAARQLRANLGSGPRTTVAGRPGSLAVYRRGRRPCLRCGTPIAWRRTGPNRRSTYWCPTCQPERRGR